MINIKKRLKRAVSFFAAAVYIFCISAAFNASADETELKKIRIPCGINDLLNYDENGLPKGHCKEYLDKLAEINGWEYEYVKSSWADYDEQLENGDIDIFFPATDEIETSTEMEFSELSGGSTFYGLFARKGDKYMYDDFQSFDGARIAITHNHSNEEYIENYSRDKGFGYTPVYVDDNNEKIRALSNGEVDMILCNSSNEIPGGELVAILDSLPFYYAVKAGNSDLLSELNSGMRRILTSYPELVTETNLRCIIGQDNKDQSFTEEEMRFIESGKEVVIGFYENTAPLAYIDKDGSYCGVYPELMRYVDDHSDLNIKLKPISRDNDWESYIKKGDIDFYIGSSAPIATVNPDILSTTAFFEYTNTLITRNDCNFKSLEKPTIVMTHGRSYWVDYLPHKLGDVNVIYCETAKECLIAVKNGKADGTLLNNIEYNYQSKNPRFSSLVANENYRFVTEGGLTTSSDVDPIMFSVVNKSLGVLTENFVDDTINSNMNMAYVQSFGDMLYASRVMIISIGWILAALVVITAVIFVIRRRQQAAAEAVKEKERRNLKILAALSHDYDAIYYTDLDEDRCELIRMVDDPVGAVFNVPNHSEAMRLYIDGSIIPEHREMVRKYSDPKEIIERFKTEHDFSIRYQVMPNPHNKEIFEMHFVNASEDDGYCRMVFGVRCVDDAAEEEKKQKQLLKDALDNANRASAAKSDFFSKMSHDIRTPMNAIIGMTAIAAAHIEEPNRVQDALKKISASSRHLLGLINEVLDMSKIESGTVSLNEEEFNLSDLMNNLITMIQPQIRQHGHNFDVQINNIAHEDVIGDSLRIQQVFVNIMGNAIKYTPDGGNILLTVTEKPANTPKAACYEFVFKDNGIGMSKEFVERIFEPFARAEDLRISKIQGTGLGMPISQNIVCMMNGSIHVESEEGKGSVFTVTMFLKIQNKEDVDTSELVGLPVLVVDDSIDVCQSVSLMLSEIGMISQSCTSGKEAVEMVRNTLGTPDHFYAAILDWKMPEMDGVQTARAIREIAGDDFPIIILSAYDWTDIEEEAKDAGVDAFLSKPLFRSGLVRLFKELKNGDSFADEGDVHNDLSQIEGSDYSGKRALLVEDNVLNREIAREVFEMTGLTVEEAENGEEAVEKFSSHPIGYYDIIFMDIQMPVMNGYEATMVIRGLKRKDAKKVPILAMTANAFAEDVQASKSAGMNEHLPKPIDFERLSKALKKYLG